MLEREEHAGGMASSFSLEGDGEQWSYDLGPHRFHTRDEELIEHVEMVLDGNSHDRAAPLAHRTVQTGSSTTRSRRGNVLREPAAAASSSRPSSDYFWVRLRERVRLSRYSDENFEDWVIRRFGRTLYKLFFGTLHRKAWKMPVHADLRPTGPASASRCSNLWRHGQEDAVPAAQGRHAAHAGDRVPLPGDRRHRRARPRLRARDRGARRHACSPTPPPCACCARATARDGVEHKGASEQVVAGDAYISHDPDHRARPLGAAGPPEDVHAAISRARVRSRSSSCTSSWTSRRSRPTTGSTCPRSTSTVHRISRVQELQPQLRARGQDDGLRARSPAASATSTGRSSDDELIADRDRATSSSSA